MAQKGVQSHNKQYLMKVLITIRLRSHPLLVQERVLDYQATVVPIHCMFTSHLQTKPDTTAIL